jgi:hypothetical protein
MWSAIAKPPCASWRWRWLHRRWCGTWSWSGRSTAAGGPPAGLVACPGAGRFMTPGAGALPSWPRCWPSGAATCGGSSGSSSSTWTPPSWTTAWSRWSGLSRATGGGRHRGGPAGRPASARLTCDPARPDHGSNSRLCGPPRPADAVAGQRRDRRRPAGRPARGLRALRPLPICGGVRALHGRRGGLPPRVGSLGTAGAPAVLEIGRCWSSSSIPVGGEAAVT